jgi:hypothetical protein
MKTKTDLQWPKGPSKSQHATLGTRQRWTTKCHRYRIERFPDDGAPLFIVMVEDGGGWRVIGHNRRLTAAKKRYQTHMKENEKKSKARRAQPPAPSRAMRR